MTVGNYEILACNETFMNGWQNRSLCCYPLCLIPCIFRLHTARLRWWLSASAALLYICDFIIRLHSSQERDNAPDTAHSQYNSLGLSMLLGNSN